jgi:hydroxymethylpyrimidine pyrophosphatase-like HAD family hydrolase
MTAVTVFADLDDTLFATREKASLRAEGGALQTAAVDRSGTPLSFHSPDQLELLDLLGGATLVPVTGRNREALDRVASPRFADYRIVSHGALIYAPGGEPLASWHSRIEEQAACVIEVMRTLADVSQRCLGPDVAGLRTRVIRDGGVPVYVSVKAAVDFLPDHAEEISVAAVSCGSNWRVHCNGHNMAILPPYADKAAAVAHVMQIKRQSDPGAVFVGIADSLTDLPYLKLCHYAVVPRDSQIQRTLWP